MVAETDIQRSERLDATVYLRTHRGVIKWMMGRALV
jgi:hypothetical protein